MSSTPATRAAVRRPKYYDLSLAHLPPPGLVSIFHRVSGALLFFPVLPLALWFMQSTLASEDGYRRFADLYAHPLVKIVLLVFVWAYAHHFWAGLRYLMLDMHMGVAKQPARKSAIAVLVLGALTTLAIGVCVW